MLAGVVVDVLDQLGKMAKLANVSMNLTTSLILVTSGSKYDIKLMARRLLERGEWALLQQWCKGLLHPHAVTIHSQLGKMYFIQSLARDALPV